MLNFRLEDWTILKNIFSNINEIIDEIVIECNPEGLKFNALDRSHICFFECLISKKFFDEYDIDMLLSLYIDVNEFVKILKRGNKKDVLIFRANNETVEIIFENKNNRSFTLTQIDMSNTSRDFPEMDFSVSFDFEFDSVLNSLKDAELYSDKLTFTREKEYLILFSEGSFGKYTNKYVLDEICSESCSASYGIDYLFKIFNKKISSNNLKISLGNNYPILVEMGEENIKVNYLLAPRIDNSE